MASSKTNRPDYSALRELFRPHIDSFDYFIDKGLDLAIKSIRPIEILDPSSKTKLRILLGESKLTSPRSVISARPMYPKECREARGTYRGELTVELLIQYNEGPLIRNKLSLGYIPIMLMSKRCHLRGADPQKLIYHREEATEMGGYFICNGLERLCRLLILPKRNYPMGHVRRSCCERGHVYSDKAIIMRCVRENESFLTVKLYYLQNGSARLGFWVKGREFLLPIGLVLKALMDTNDHEIYVSLTSCYNERYQREKSAVGSQLIGERAQVILDEVRKLSLYTRSDCLKHLGEYFRPAIEGFEIESYKVVSEAVLRDYVLVHLTNNHDKFNLLIFMLQKLYALVDQTAAPDNEDVLQNQEVLLPGNLMTFYLKAKLVEWLSKSRYQLIDQMAKEKVFDIKDPEQVRKFLSRGASTIGRSMQSMISNGRFNASVLYLPQKEGMTIQAERLNYLRYISHFRAVHRGAVFAKMRTTAVRKLMPESWGFLCPVHTPDGEPCGLLNHMTSTCRVASYFNSEGKIKDFRDIQRSVLNVLIRLGISPSLPKLELSGPPEVLHVLLDGRVVGSIAGSEVEKAVKHIRNLKLSASSGIPEDLEVGYVPLSLGGAYPGLYLFTSPSRFLRPVKNLSHTSDRDIELIGPFEQAFMEIRCADGGDGGRRSFPVTHEEIHPTGILSVVANLTPWSDHNQSPRNMYQCQMAKQTMGFSSHALQFRFDEKTYHLQTPQSPIVRTASYNKYCMDEFPTGTNAIVAVLAYTGQNVSTLAGKGEEKSVSKVFARSNDKTMDSSIDVDGLPFIGQTINPKEPLYSTQDLLTNMPKAIFLKGSEPVMVDAVTVDGTGVADSKRHAQKKSGDW